MIEIEIQLTLYQLRNYTLRNQSVYFDIFFSNCHKRSNSFDPSQASIQDHITIKSYFGEEFEIWMRDSHTREMLGFSKVKLNNGHMNVKLMVDQYTKVGELILKSQVTHRCIDREEVQVLDEQFFKIEETIDNEKEQQEEEERRRLLEQQREQERLASLMKISTVLVTNKSGADQNIF